MDQGAHSVHSGQDPSLHSFSSLSSPSHSPGKLHLLFLFWAPSPQLTLHWPHPPTRSTRGTRTEKDSDRILTTLILTIVLLQDSPSSMGP